jgi:hypothetical protein
MPLHKVVNIVIYLIPKSNRMELELVKLALASGSTTDGARKGSMARFRETKTSHTSTRQNSLQKDVGKSNSGGRSLRLIHAINDLISGSLDRMI